MINNIVVTGSLAYDHIMSMPGRFRDHILPDKLHMLNVSFIMDSFRQEFGGTAGNIAYTLGLLKTRSILTATAGDDFDLYKKHLSKVGFITSKVKIFKKSKTAKGFVTTDKDDNQIWGFYEGAMKFSDKLSLRPLLKEHTFLVVAPNNPSAMMKYVEEAISRKCRYMFDPAFNIPHFSLKDLKSAILNSTILIGNDYEIALIQRRLNTSIADLVGKSRLVITTLGRNGSQIRSRSQCFDIPLAKPKNESDPTGAGDAYRAGFLGGFVRNLPLEVCGKMGALAATYTVEKYGTQTHNFTIREFKKRYKENFKENLRISEVAV